MIVPLLLLAARAAAASPEAALGKLFRRIEALEARETGLDARGVRALEAQIEALAPRAVKLGPAAAAPLAAIARDPKRSAEARLWAAVFLGLLRDPAALSPLREVLCDEKVPEAARAEAASAILDLDVSAAAQRAALGRALATELSGAALLETLRGLSRLGGDDAAALERRAKQFGPRPKGLDAAAVALAVAALSRSHPVEAARTLWRVYDYFPKGSPERRAALDGLLAQRENQRAFADQAFARAQDALYAESAYPETAAAAARLLAGFDDPKAAPTLERFLANHDAEVATVAAEGLARLKAARSRPALQKLLDGVADDPRFASAPGRPDPAALAARIAAALKALK